MTGKIIPPLTREAYSELSRKWSLLIIKAIFLGKTRFNEFLNFYENEGLSNKMLANQLKRLEHFGYISKVIVSKTPLIAEYRLTEMGLVYSSYLFTQSWTDYL